MSDSTKISRDAYNLWSQSYDGLDNPMLAMVDHAFDIEPLISSKKRVIELGCGTGRNIARVISNGALSYVGVDQSDGMLEKARAKFPQFGFLNADIQRHLPFETGRADLILVTLVFEHLPNLLPTLQEAHRVLAPGGLIRILEIHSDLTSRGTGAHFQHGDREIALPSYAHDSNEWQSTLLSAGLTLSSIKSLVADAQAIKRCAKLSKHQGHAVLFDIQARKSP